MKIVFLSQIVPYPPHGGVLQRGYNLIRELGRNNEVLLMAFLHPDTLPNDKMVERSRMELSRFCTSLEYFELWPKKSSLHKCAGILMGQLSSLPFSVLAHRSRRLQQRLSDVIDAEKVDLVHFDTIALARYNHRIPVPKVVTHQNIESDLMRRRARKEKNPFARKYLSKQSEKIQSYEIEQCPGFDLNIVVSDEDGRKLKGMNSDLDIAVVPNGVDVRYFKPSKNDAPQTCSLVYAGGMNMFANRDAVLFFLNEIYPRIKLRVPSARFYAVGQDPPPELLRIARRNRDVVATGYVDDIRPYVNQSMLYVVPLRVGGGTRLKVLDAMALGKAIVSTTIGCEGLDVTPDKNIVVADDPASFVEKTVQLLKSPERCKQIGSEARRLVKSRYSWKIVGRELEAAYSRAVAKRKEVDSYYELSGRKAV